VSLLETAFSHMPFLPAHETPKGTPKFAGARFDLGHLGEILREARESKGISLADVAESLFVKKSTLCSIESGDWNTLPHPVYVKGYVKSYAAYLGVPWGIEDGLCPDRGAVPEKRPEDQGCATGKGEDPKKRHGVRRLSFFSLKKIAIICSSIAGLILGIAISPGFQVAAPVSLNDVLTACHDVVAGLRRFILP
jgi:transcriptional regulator with XRE-family HTH domain